MKLLLPAMIAVGEQLDLLNDSVRKSNAAATRAALARAHRVMCEYAQAEFVRREPAPLARCIVNAAAGRAIGQGASQSLVSDDSGASGAGKKRRKGRKATKRGKKRASGRPARRARKDA